MSNYVKATDFASKDALLSGNPSKIIKGTEIDTEFNSIATAIQTKADLASPTFTGTPSAPTAADGTNTTQIATTAFTTSAISAERTASTTLTNKTINGSNNTITNVSLTTGVTGTLPVANGGTGATTLTGVLIGNGTSAVTVKTNPSGAFVGTTDSQTLSNKTFSGAQTFGTASLAQPSGSAPLYMIRAFVNFNASSGTPSIRNSQNVTSITDNGVGDFTINLTTAMTDTNFTAVSNTALDPASYNATQLVRNSDSTAFPSSSSAVRYCTGSSGGSTVNDALWNEVIVIR